MTRLRAEALQRAGADRTDFKPFYQFRIYPWKSAQIRFDPRSIAFDCIFVWFLFCLIVNMRFSLTFRCETEFRGN
jgi:hypothetical protein